MGTSRGTIFGGVVALCTMGWLGVAFADDPAAAAAAAKPAAFMRCFSGANLLIAMNEFHHVANATLAQDVVRLSVASPQKTMTFRGPFRVSSPAIVSHAGLVHVCVVFNGARE